MKTGLLAVADTTPLNYLILIGCTDILGQLFKEVLIPNAVLNELRHPKAPVEVSRWLISLPAWLRIQSVTWTDPTIQLGDGENEAISLALEQNIPIVMMDERKGRAAAEARGLLPIGTLNLLDLADEAGFIDGMQALRELRKTTFRAEAKLISQFENKMSARRV
ncbi:hypothetical protein WJU23_16130 [Prosthecobacter sp. SYSU 5D2]|uniref:DUF3368 domain-containing protein n=1 Tax=Prosthecobacter sp. SYSU 5D2 TaxID=3134134 RepID=UPI0031FEE9E9